MSTDCPPQLQLSIQANTTSFKRSFEQFGFDLESPVGSGTGPGAHAPGSDGRSERNKRARSTICFDSEASSDTSSDTLASTSSSGSSALSQGGASAGLPTTSLIQPPRLPTPELQDVEMPDYPVEDPSNHLQEPLRSGDHFQRSLQRFNEFDSQIALLRQSPSSTTPPPTLPPLRHRLVPDDVAFFRRHSPSASPSMSSNAFVENGSQMELGSASLLPQVSANSTSSFDLMFRETQSLPPLSLPGINTGDATQLSSPTQPADFRDRLNTALERLRSDSPLVPGLEDSDPDLRDEDNDMQDSEDDEEGERETQRDANGNHSIELPPTLPPIETTEHSFHDEVSPLGQQEPPPTILTVPPDPPTLPPIPPLHASDRSWVGHGQLFSERLDDFMGLTNNPTSNLEANVIDRAPVASVNDGRPNLTSPRPFSRSVGTPLPPSPNHSLMPNTSLGDHPLPSPILRDLHNWIEARQPAPQHDHNFGDGTGSLSSTAATAGTEPTGRNTSAPAPVVSPPRHELLPTTTQNDRLSRILDRTRTGSRAEDLGAYNNRHRWLSHATGWSNYNAESDILQDLLPYYYPNHPSETRATSLTANNATQGTSRPISTTPAPGSPLNPGENATLDSFWEPVFNNLPEASLSRTARTTTLTPSAEQQSHSRRQSEARAVRSTGISYGNRPTANPAGAGSQFMATTSNRSNVSHETPRELPRRLGNSNDLSSNGHTSDPSAGLWRALEAVDLPLGFQFNAPSSPSGVATTADFPQRLTQTTSAYNEPDITPSSYRAMMGISSPASQPATSFADSSRTAQNLHSRLNTLFPGGGRTELERRTEARRQTLQRQHEAFRSMLDSVESSLPALAPSNLSNWNGRLRRTSDTEDPSAAVSTRSGDIAPSAASSSVFEWLSASAVDSRRADPLRHRTIRSHNPSRPGSSNSLVAENASEVRRRADQAEIRQAFPRNRRTLFLDDFEDSTDNDSDTWENMITGRGWGHHWRRRSTPVSSESVRDAGITVDEPTYRYYIPASNSDVMDTSESTSTGPNNQAPGAPPNAGQSYAPSLPPPDLGTSFDAGTQSPTTDNVWAPGNDSFNNASPGTSVDGTNRVPVPRQRSLRFRDIMGITSPNQPHQRQRDGSRERTRQQIHEEIVVRARERERERWSISERGTQESRYYNLNPNAPSSSPAADTARPPTLNDSRRTATADSVSRYAHFDPSTFAAGPFRNTLQHYANERGQGTRAEESTSRSNMRHDTLLPLSLINEDRWLTDPSPSTQTHPHPDASTIPPREAPPDSPANSRWLHEMQLRSAIADRYRTQQRRQEAARAEDASRHTHAHAHNRHSEHVPAQPEDSASGARVPPPMQRYRRLVVAQMEDEEVAVFPEMVVPRGGRNPRRSRGGNAVMLSRLPPPNAGPNGFWRRGRPLGDFVRDEDFDDSYENLMSLSMQIGEAKPRSTPSEVVQKMQKGMYRDFAGEGTDTRCPICLDDYEPTDPVQKMNNCSHWLHEACLSQWLQTASTCPVCRESVTSPRSSPFSQGRLPRFRSMMPFQSQVPRRRRDASPTAPPSAPPAPPPAPTRLDRPAPSVQFGGDIVIEDSNDTQQRERQEGTGRPNQQTDRANPGAPWRHNPTL